MKVNDIKTAVVSGKVNCVEVLQALIEASEELETNRDKYKQARAGRIILHDTMAKILKVR